MITMGAREIVNALKNVIPFASTDVDDAAYNVVRIDFDGGDLCFSASNRSQHVRYRANVDEDPSDDGEMDWQYGLAAEAQPFSVRLDLTTAKGVSSALTMNPAKLMYAPVTLKVVPDVGERNMFKVKFIRDGNDPLWTPLAFHASGHGRPVVEDGDAPEVDINALIDGNAKLSQSNEAVAWNVKHLANFAKTAVGGTLEMEFTGGSEQAVRVRIGNRFQGVVWPAKLEKPAAADGLLRTGSGVLLGVSDE